MREQYLEMRRTSQYDLNWFFQHYLQNKTEEMLLLPFEVFLQIFRMYFQIHAQNIFDTLDVKFEVQKIEDINRKILYMM